MDDGCFTRKSFIKTTYALVLLVIVHVTLSKISILFGIPFLTESGCKGKEFQAYLPNIWGSFFSLFPGGLQRSLAKGKDTGKNPDRDQDSKHRRFVFKSGCKGKKFQAYPPIFFRSFFSEFFSRLKARKTWKDAKALTNRNCLTKCHISKLPFPKAGAKLGIRIQPRKHWHNFFARKNKLLR